MKSFLSILPFLATVAFARPSTVSKRQAVNDGVILNYALTLEHLEATFYATYLAKYDQAAFDAAGFGGNVRNAIEMVAGHEATHVSFLTGALKAAGVTPTAACEYSFPVKDVPSFLAVAQVLEGVGVSAYLGAAASITNKAYLTDAAAVLTVESRHNAFIREHNGDGPFPAAFDIPLDFDQVYTLASAFITSCPSSNPALPVKAFPSLTIAETGALKAGSFVHFQSPALKPSMSLYAAFIQPTGILYKQLGANYKAEIPTSILPGQNYVVLTTSQDLTDANTVAGPYIFDI